MKKKKTKPSLESRLQRTSLTVASGGWGYRAAVGTGPGLRHADPDHRHPPRPPPRSLSSPGAAHSGSVQLSPELRSGLMSGSSDLFQVGEKFTFQKGSLIERHIPKCACNDTPPRSQNQLNDHLQDL